MLPLGGDCGLLPPGLLVRAIRSTLTAAAPAAAPAQPCSILRAPTLLPCEQLLLYPNPSDPLNGEAAALHMRDPVAYQKKVCCCLRWLGCVDEPAIDAVLRPVD